MARKVKDAVDLTTNEKIYFKGHAKATYLSDGRDVEKALGEIPTAESDVFVAVYKQTTFDEIVAARNEGKVVICNNSQIVYILTFLTNGAAYFTSHYSGYVYQLICNKSGVGQSSSQNISHKLESLDNGNVQITIVDKVAEVATPQYVDEKVSVFEAIYGETTYDEIVEANNAGKEVVCNYNNWFARLARIQESRVILQAFSEGIIMILFCSNKNEGSLVWKYTDHKLETVDDNIVKITIANVSEEIATPEYVSNAITTAITNELTADF